MPSASKWTKRLQAPEYWHGYRCSIVEWPVAMASLATVAIKWLASKCVTAHLGKAPLYQCTLFNRYESNLLRSINIGPNDDLLTRLLAIKKPAYAMHVRSGSTEATLDSTQVANPRMNLNLHRSSRTIRERAEQWRRKGAKSGRRGQ